jgi:uncharacterized membrane protein YcfT
MTGHEATQDGIVESRAPEIDRVPWVDTAKGLCIILVVMMHVTLGVGEAMGEEGFMHAFVAFAKPFRMPDFFLVSGLFLARVIDRDWRSYADKRVVHFLYFYVLWLVIQSVLKFGSVSGGTIGGFVGHLAWSFVEPFSTLWFVYLLAIFSVVTKLLRFIPGPWLLVGAAALEILPVHTGWVLIDEFAGRYVYFLAGYLLAPLIFRFAMLVPAHRNAALAGLALWAGINGIFAVAPTGHPVFDTWASLPFVSLALGAAGACAIIAVSALLTDRGWAGPLAYCGRQSIAIYLAFFLPMAATRIILVRAGLIDDAGIVALITTIVAVTAPLVLERLVRGTWAGFLFVRPAAFHIVPTRGPRLAPAE